MISSCLRPCFFIDPRVSCVRPTFPCIAANFHHVPGRIPMSSSSLPDPSDKLGGVTEPLQSPEPRDLLTSLGLTINCLFCYYCSHFLFWNCVLGLPVGSQKLLLAQTPVSASAGSCEGVGGPRLDPELAVWMLRCEMASAASRGPKTELDSCRRSHSR